MSDIEISSVFGKVKINFSFGEKEKAVQIGSYIADALNLLKANDNVKAFIKHVYAIIPEITEMRIKESENEEMILNKEELKRKPLKVLLSLSGGLDSTTLLYYLIDKGFKVKAISFNYGSKHNDHEIPCAKKICETLGIEHQIIDLDFVNKYFRSNLLQNGGAIPDGHYSSETMKPTVVPFRNGIMLSISAGIAESNDCEFVALASHAGDHTIYPDCRPEFTNAFAKAIMNGTEKGIQLIAPFNKITKSDIVKLGAKLGVNFSLTYSCYKGRDKHCGKCGTCIERKEAFELAKIKDPTIYED